MMGLTNTQSIITAEQMAALDITALESAQLPQCVYSSVKQAASQYGDQVAIKYLLDGQCLGPKKIPFKKRLIHQGVKLVKGKSFAQPYREVTYNQLAVQVTQVANALVGLGLNSGSVVSLLLPNFPETYSALWGAETVGVANPINPMLEADIIAEIMNTAKSEVLIALGPVPGSDIWPKVQSIKDKVPTLRAVISLFGDNEQTPDKVPVYDFHQWLSDVDSERFVGELPSQQTTAAYFHTGGTTGLPKLAKQSQLNQLSNAKQVNLVLPLSQGDTMLVGLPIFHVNAANATGLGSVMAGVTILMAGPAGFRSAHVLPNLVELLIHFDVSVMMAVPTVYAAVVESLGNEDQLNLSDLKMKLAISGAAPLSPVLKQNFIEKLGIPLVEGYGATETTAVSSLMPINDIAVRQSVGLPLPALDLKIANIDEQGELVEVCDIDQVGEIVVAGPNVFQGYLEPSHNEQSWITLPDEYAKDKRYFRTGDLGCLDQHGYLSLAGRQKELIIRGGHNIDPKMIEDIASRHPAVSLAAAVGRPDAYAGEVPVLYVTYAEHQQASEAEILAYVSQHIPERAATPKQVIALSEMPTTAIGKIFKPQLNCYQVESVVDAVLTKIDGIASEDIRVSASPSKQFGISAVISLSEKAESTRAEVEEALANFSFHYQFEQASTLQTSQGERVA